MHNKDLTFTKKKADTKELIEMVEKLPYEKKKTIHDMIKGYELLSMAKIKEKSPA